MMNAYVPEMEWVPKSTGKHSNPTDGEEELDNPDKR